MDTFMKFILKFLLPLLLLSTVSCSSIKKIGESNNYSHDKELIDFLFSNEHLIEKKISDFNDILILNKNIIPIGDFYYYNMQN